MKMFVSIVNKEDLERVWPVVAPYLDKACRRSGGRRTLEQCVKHLLTGFWQLWICYEEDGTVYCAAISTINVYENHKSINCLLMGGNQLKKWYHLLAGAIEQFGRDNGCTRAETVCRLGLVDTIRNDGAKLTHVLMDKEL